MLGKRRIFVEVAAVAEPLARQRRLEAVRLREDRVALRVLRDIEHAISAHVPHGRLLILTLGAPIKVPAQLVAALTRALETYLKRGIAEVDERRTILGNRVRFRVVNDRLKWKAKVVGFVFTGDPVPGVIASSMAALHGEIAARAKRRVPKPSAGDRWLVLLNDRWPVDFTTYLRAYSLLPAVRAFDKVLMVFAGGRVETLTEA